MRTFLRGKAKLLVLALGLLLAVPAIALADNIVNDIEATVHADSVVNATVGQTVTVGYLIQATGASQICDAADGSKATLTPSKESGPGTVTISPTSQDYTACDTSKTFNFSADTPGDYVIAVAVADTNGDYNTTTGQWKLRVASATATNQAPTADAGGPYSVDEGSSVQLSGSGTDSDGTIASYAWDLDNDGQYDDSTDQNPTFSAANLDGPSSHTVGLQVTDDDGAPGTDTATVNVLNVAPTVTLSGPPSVDENNAGSENYSFTVSDPGGDTITSVSADCDADSGTDDGILQGSQPTVSNKSFSCRFPDGPASALVSVSATDDDGATGSNSTTVSIANVAPRLSNLQLANATGPACIGGNTVSITYNVFDPGDDTFSLDPGVNWGDGTTNTSSSHTYGAGTYTISVQGKDSDGAASNQLASNTNAVSLLYNMTGILSPFNPDGSSVWKYGSTIPVKVKITDCNSAPVSGLAPKLGLSLANAATPAPPVNETDLASTSAADDPTAPVLRYSSSDGVYIYNLSTKYTTAFTDPNATYWATVKGLNTAGQTVTSPAQVSQKFGLKSK